MHISWYILVSILLCLVLLGHSSEAKTVTTHENQTTKAPKPKLLLLSVGGLSGHYLTSFNLTYIQQMIANGTIAKYVQNSVNVQDIVDHYSITTGLYPESHGIISNTMYDPKLKLVFNKKTHADPAWWQKVHPIWLEFEKQGLGLSAVCRWPGVFGPMVLSLRCGERKSVTSDVRQALKWLNDGVQLVLLYTDDIKKAALKWGPYSRQAINELQKLDFIIKYLLQKTRDTNLNIILTSDSGVVELNNRTIDLDRCLDPKSYVLTQSQGTLLFYPKRGYTTKQLYKNLTDCKHVKVYLKEELPMRYHFSNNHRIPPIIAFVPLGVLVKSTKITQQRYNRGGTGYHPGYEVMRGVFVGYGPSFQPSLKFRAIENVDIYGIVCHLLNVNPRPNNGSYELITSMFTNLMPLAPGVTTGDVRTPDDVTAPTSGDVITAVTSGAPKLSEEDSRMETDVKVLFWILLAVTAFLMLFCCVACCATLYSNMKKGERHQIKVRGGAKRLLLNDSTDDE